MPLSKNDFSKYDKMLLTNSLASLPIKSNWTAIFSKKKNVLPDENGEFPSLPRKFVDQTLVIVVHKLYWPFSFSSSKKVVVILRHQKLEDKGCLIGLTGPSQQVSLIRLQRRSCQAIPLISDNKKVELDLNECQSLNVAW